MADIVSRMRVAKTLLASYQHAPGFSHVAASECETLNKEIEAAELTTAQIADCMEEISTLGFDANQKRELLEALRAKLASHGAPKSPPSHTPPTMQSVPPFQPCAAPAKRQNYETLTMYIPASVRLWKPSNPIARGL